MDTWMDYKKSENLRPLTIPNKEKYYFDIVNIEHSFSGRIDGGLSNTFIMEAERLLINAIELFEMGYFDCAYYSLRSAIDVSSTMVYLVDMPDKEREEKLEAWKETKDFPMQGRLLKELSEKGDVYKDMLSKMPVFFSNAKVLAKLINKYVHKQGLQHFYVSRNHPVNLLKPQDTFIRNFVYYLKQCIGIVGVMRLAIDPFPILLMDEEILYRCFDSMTEAYSQDFIDEYIGQDTIDAYKTTELYEGTYNSFISDEKKNEATFDVMKFQYINTEKKEEIFSQLHLLNSIDIIAITLVFACEKVVKVYDNTGLYAFSTDRKSKRKKMGWDGLEFRQFTSNSEKYNQPYDEALISVFQIGSEAYLVEHNEQLTADEINEIQVKIDELQADKTYEVDGGKL